VCACVRACACALDVPSDVFVSTNVRRMHVLLHGVFMGVGLRPFERRPCPVVATLQSLSPKLSNSLPSWSTPVAKPPIPTPDPRWSAGKSFPPTGKAVQNSFCGCTASQEECSKPWGKGSASRLSRATSIAWVSLCLKSTTGIPWWIRRGSCILWLGSSYGVQLGSIIRHKRARPIPPVPLQHVRRLAHSPDHEECQASHGSQSRRPSP
jgi:hypothetical protein